MKRYDVQMPTGSVVSATEADLLNEQKFVLNAPVTETSKRGRRGSTDGLVLGTWYTDFGQVPVIVARSLEDSLKLVAFELPNSDVMLDSADPEAPSRMTLRTSRVMDQMDEALKQGSALIVSVSSVNSFVISAGIWEITKSGDLRDFLAYRLLPMEVL